MGRSLGIFVVLGRVGLIFAFSFVAQVRVTPAYEGVSRDWGWSGGAWLALPVGRMGEGDQFITSAATRVR